MADPGEHTDVGDRGRGPVQDLPCLLWEDDQKTSARLGLIVPCRAESSSPIICLSPVDSTLFAFLGFGLTTECFPLSLHHLNKLAHSLRLNCKKQRYIGKK